MQTYTMHMHNATTKPRKQKEEQTRPTKLTKEKSAIKRGNKPLAPLASEQRCPAQEVWLGYLRFASLKGHGSSLCNRISMCLVLECRTGFFAMLIVDILSMKMGTLS